MSLSYFKNPFKKRRSTSSVSGTLASPFDTQGVPPPAWSIPFLEYSPGFIPPPPPGGPPSPSDQPGFIPLPSPPPVIHSDYPAFIPPPVIPSDQPGFIPPPFPSEGPIIHSDYPAFIPPPPSSGGPVIPSVNPVFIPPPSEGPIIPPLHLGFVPPPTPPLPRRSRRSTQGVSASPPPVAKLPAISSIRTKPPKRTVTKSDLFASFPDLDLTGRVQKLGQFPEATNGGFADIWKGNLNGSTVAVKVMRFALVSVSDVSTSEAITEKKIYRELKTWSHAKHDHVLPLLGFTRDFGYHVSLVSPWQDKGDAPHFLKNKGRSIAISVTFGAAKGLEYLHELGIVHGDFRGSNILITDDERAVVADFGLSRLLDPSLSTTTGSAAGGNAAWMSPELFHPPYKATFKSDVWAFGMTTLELMSGKKPYYECKYPAVVISTVLLGKKPPRQDVPPEIYDHFLKAVLQSQIMA